MITNLSIGNYGRWGNMCFQIAAVIGIARKSGQDFGFPPIINSDHKERFGSTEDIELDKYFLNPLPGIDGRSFTERPISWGYHPDIYLPVGDWNITGHFQSEKYFSHCMEEVRHWLTFKDEPAPNNYVAIHYRAGDYQEGGKSVYHPRCSKEYYEQAMAMFPGREFLIFSDEHPDKVMRMFEGHKVAYGNDYIKDFKIMKSCHSFICANSSYSLIAAILADHSGKKIVCPSLWFGDPGGGLKMDYPENAIII